MTIEEENAKLREIVENHCLQSYHLCSQTLRDLRKIRAMEDVPTPFEVKERPNRATDYRIQW
jgi:hypothetical protein